MEAAERQGSVARVGSYEVVRKLARGGMADLFLARTVTDTFERLVVIKKILSRYADNPRFVQLFHDEAKLAKSLKHKNIVEVFDVGGTGGESFFAMEYLHGQDVRELLHRSWKRDERMPIKYAVQIGIQVSSALNYAHSMRRPDGTLLDIVHRDVSPSNIIVSYEGAVKLLDFGVAKAATSSVKTRTGTLKGKIAYMSPEQAKGGSVDKRSDVFSLGICLWEMITTSRLFRGENDLATLQLIINEAPKRPSEVNPECPKELERIVLRALAQDPKQRYQTALELQQELEEYVRTQQLVQSSGELGAYMSVLFQPEIASWKEAKAAGTQLSEHLTSVHENTTPVSESEFIEPEVEDEDDYEEELEDDLDQAAISGSIETKTAIPTPVAKISSAPIVRPMLSRATPSTPMPVLPAMPPVVQRASLPPGLMNVTVPDPNQLPFSAEQAARLRRQFWAVGSGVLCLMILIGLIRACAGGGTEVPKPPPEKESAPAITLPMVDARVEAPAIPDAAEAAPVEPVPEAVTEPATDAGSAVPKPVRKDKRRPVRTNTPGTYESPVAPPRPKRK